MFSDMEKVRLELDSSALHILLVESSTNTYLGMLPESDLGLSLNKSQLVNNLNPQLYKQIINLGTKCIDMRDTVISERHLKLFLFLLPKIQPQYHLVPVSRHAQQWPCLVHNLATLRSNIPMPWPMSSQNWKTQFGES